MGWPSAAPTPRERMCARPDGRVSPSRGRVGDGGEACRFSGVYLRISRIDGSKPMSCTTTSARPQVYRCGERVNRVRARQQRNEAKPCQPCTREPSARAIRTQACSRVGSPCTRGGICKQAHRHPALLPRTHVPPGAFRTTCLPTHPPQSRQPRYAGSALRGGVLGAGRGAHE